MKVKLLCKAGIGLFLLIFLFCFLLFGQGETIRLTKSPPSPVVLARVECTTTVDRKVPIEIEVYSNWAPIGARRFLHLVKIGYYDNSPLFRVVKKENKPGFIVQFGISLDKEKEEEWGNRHIPDDPLLQFPFQRGFLCYGGGGYNSRSSQIFIVYSATRTRHLGKVPWETPFAKVVSGMDIVDQFYSGDEKGVLDMPPWGVGPAQGKIKEFGRSYLLEEFPKLDYIETCKVVEEGVDPMPHLQEHVLGKAQWRPLEKENNKNEEQPQNREQRKKTQEETKKENEHLEERNAFLKRLKEKQRYRK